MLISNLFQLKIELYCEKNLCTHFDNVSEQTKSETKTKGENTSLSNHLFFYRL